MSLTDKYAMFYTLVEKYTDRECVKLQDILLLHFAFRRITLSTNKCTYIKFHIKTLKIAPTCFDP